MLGRQDAGRGEPLDDNALEDASVEGLTQSHRQRATLSRDTNILGGKKKKKKKGKGLYGRTWKAESGLLMQLRACGVSAVYNYSNRLDINS